MTNLIKVLNDFFTNCDSSQLVKSFEHTTLGYIGKIRVNTEGVKLDFDTTVPQCFPFNNNQTCIRFVNRALIGYSHINLDGSVCLHSLSSEHINTRLNEEFNLLKLWIKKYYIDNEQDKPYQYLQIPIVSTGNIPYVHTLLFNNLNKEYKLHSFGHFQYSIIGIGLYILQNIENQELEWSRKDRKSVV